MSSSSVDIDTCGICKKRFNKDDRKPKFLTCYHTYCYTCLTSIKEEVTLFSALYMFNDSYILDETKGGVASKFIWWPEVLKRKLV